MLTGLTDGASASVRENASATSNTDTRTVWHPERIDKIQRASGKRLLKSDHEGELRGELVTMLFEAAEAAKGSRGKGSRDGKPAARSRR